MCRPDVVLQAVTHDENLVGLQIVAREGQPEDGGVGLTDAYGSGLDDVAEVGGKTEFAEDGGEIAVEVADEQQAQGLGLPVWNQRGELLKQRARVLHLLLNAGVGFLNQGVW